MLDTERKKLTEKETDYVGIGVTGTGEHVGSIWVPWDSTANAFNMRTPDIFLTPEDLSDEAVLSLFEGKKVIGFYCFEPLSDYSILTRFPTLQDIYLERSGSIRDLDFLRELPECRMLYLEDAALKNLDAVLDQKRDRWIMGLCCLGLWNCTVEDLSAFENEEHYFSEFIVWQPEGTGDRARWNAVCAGKRLYFEFRPKE